MNLNECKTVMHREQFIADAMRKGYFGFRFVFVHIPFGGEPYGRHLVRLGKTRKQYAAEYDKLARDIFMFEFERAAADEKYKMCIDVLKSWENK